MKRLFTLGACIVASYSFSQTVVYTNDFEGAPGVTLNTTDVGGTAAGENPWIINNVYTGGTGSFMCLGFPFPFTVPAAATQPAGITNSPTSQYLHVTPQIAIDDGGPTLPAASYVAADGICIFGGQSTFTAMSSDISTVGYDSVNIDLWWMCGGSVFYYGEVYYSTDGGTNWTALTCPTTGTTEWRTQTSWTNSIFTDPALDGQATLRLGFRFVSGTDATGATDPGFAVDDIEITGYTLCTPTASNITETACDSYMSPAGNTYTMTGTYFDTIPNVGGCDSIITIDLTINTVDVGVTQSGVDLMADQNGATYQWIDCNNGFAPIAGATSQTYTTTMDGNYAVIVDTAGCVDTSACFFVVGHSIDENAFGDVIKLYPNPAEGQVFINITDQSIGAISVRITNVEGKLISEAVYTEANPIQIELEGDKGVYIIQITADDRQQHYRVIKQ